MVILLTVSAVKAGMVRRIGCGGGVTLLNQKETDKLRELESPEEWEVGVPALECRKL